MKLALNHVENIGYYSCCFGKMKKIHMLKKGSYYFQEIFQKEKLVYLLVGIGSNGI